VVPEHAVAAAVEVGYGYVERGDGVAVLPVAFDAVARDRTAEK